jgi:hypothetical protein
MANTLSNTLDKIGNVVESIMSATNKATQYEGSNRVYMGQTCLERFGMEARNAHLLRNEWRKDLAYSKPLVDAEYMIQTEFKVSSYEDRLNEQAQESAEKADKQAEKKAKKAAKDAKKAENAASVQGGIPEDRPAESKENIGDFTVTKIGNQTFTTYRTYGIYGKSN